MPRIDMLLGAICLSVLAGCAGMSEQECLATDWRSVGFEDGAAGRSATSIGNYRNACGQYGVAPNLDSYRQGHAEGVELYCRPSRGFDVGRSGGRYQGVCPAETESAFLAAYSEGRTLYELESSVRAINNEINARHRRLEAIEGELASSAAAIIADGTSVERRAELLLNTKALTDEQETIERELETLEVERLVAEDELVAYQQTLAFEGG